MSRTSFDTNKSRILRRCAQLFARNGYHATGIAEISRAVKLGRGALYHYIGNKETILFEISITQVDRMNEVAETIIASEGSPEDKLRELARSLLTNIAEYHHEWTVFFREYGALTGDRRALVIAARQRYEDQWQKLFVAGEEQGRFVVVGPIKVKALLGMFNYSYLWYRKKGELTPAQVADEFVDAILNGIRAPRAGERPAEPVPAAAAAAPVPPGPASSDGGTDSTWQRLLRASAVVFARDGYHGAGISDICAEANVSRGALYHYIANKETLLYEICRRQVNMLNAQAEVITSQALPAPERLRRLGQALLRNITENLAEWTVFFTEFGAVTGARRTEILRARETFEAHWSRVLAEGHTEGSLRETPPLLVKGALGMFNYTYLWLRPDGDRSPEQLADDFVALLLDGILVSSH